MLESVGSRTRVLLSWSLGGLVLLAAVIGVAALLVFDHVRSGQQALRTGFLERSARLERIRGGVYTSGILAEDYFAAPKETDRVRLHNLEAESTAAATEYGDANLRGEVIAYWRVL